MSTTTIERTANILDLTLRSVFIPFSQSRRAAEKEPSLNWRITLRHTGRDVLTTDYSAGCGHCPSYQQRQTVDGAAAVLWECEHGQAYRAGRYTLGPLILPAFVDVLASLACDANAIDYPTFEDWASVMGYDSDSRAAERTYRSCLDIGLRLRAALGEAGLQTLHDACRDYQPQGEP